AAGGRVERGGGAGGAAHLDLAGRDRRQDLRRGLEADELDVETFTAEEALVLGNEDASIGDRADGADLERDARLHRSGLCRGSRNREREQGEADGHGTLLAGSAVPQLRRPPIALSLIPALRTTPPLSLHPPLT